MVHCTIIGQRYVDFYQELIFRPDRPLQESDMWDVILFDQSACRIRFKQ
jgi:glucose dehydrogenase